MADQGSDDVVFVPEGEQPEVEKLEEIKVELEQITQNTSSGMNWFVRGMLQGAGAIIGSIAMLIFLGWFLSWVGLIPGFDDIAAYISGFVEQVSQ